MKKKLLLLMAAILILISAAGCSSDTERHSADNSAPDSAQEPATEESDKTIKIGLITGVGGINDQGYNEASWSGLQKAAKDFGVKVKYLEATKNSDFAPSIQTFIDEDYDLIIGNSFSLIDEITTAATENPDIRFAIIDAEPTITLPNLTYIQFAQSEVSYLVGIVAAMSTETNTTGIVVGASNNIMSQFGYGYIAGIKDTNPDVIIKQKDALSFADLPAGKSCALQLISDGADVIFHVAGGTGTGVIEGCKEGGIWAIGADVDQSILAPDTILTSALKRLDNACYDTINNLLSGTLNSGSVTYNIANEGVDIAPTINHLTDDIISAVNTAKESIKSGKITVPNSKEAFETKYGNIYELD